MVLIAFSIDTLVYRYSFAGITWGLFMQIAFMNIVSSPTQAIFDILFLFSTIKLFIYVKLNEISGIYYYMYMFVILY